MITPLPLTYLRDLDALDGAPRITFPDSLDYPVIERTLGEFHRTPLAAFGSADPDTTNFPNCKLVGCQITGTDADRRRVYRKWERVPGYASITPFVDEETQTPGTITRQLVVKPSFPLAQTPGTLTTYTPINDYCGTLTTQTLTGYAAITRPELAPGQFTFPHLVFGVATSLIGALDGTTRIVQNWDERPAFSNLTNTRSVVTYNTRTNLVAAAPTTLYSPVLNTLYYDGVFFNVQKTGVLNDEITVGPYSTGTENLTWGYVVELPVTFPESALSATEYQALIGTFVNVDVQIIPWKYNLWRMTVRQVQLL